MQCTTRHSTGQDRARQDTTGQDRAGQGRAGQGRAVCSSEGLDGSTKNH